MPEICDFITHPSAQYWYNRWKSAAEDAIDLRGALNDFDRLLKERDELCERVEFLRKEAVKAHKTSRDFTLTAVESKGTKGTSWFVRTVEGSYVFMGEHQAKWLARWSREGEVEFHTTNAQGQPDPDGKYMTRKLP